MTDAELEALLEQLEAGLAEDVQGELNAVAREFARSVDSATELVAAAFSVSSIRRMWQRRVPRVMDSLRRITRRAARTVADDQGVRVPSTAELDDALGGYFDATRQLLDGAGDRLATQAAASLAEGVNAGESVEQLKRRMTAVFNRSGAQLGPVRADRIARTEATRAFNAGVQAAAEVITGPDRPLVKQWLTRLDEKVRKTHKKANGQIQLLGDPFDVGGFPMQYPGDPAAPADETVNCRCILKTAAPTERTASMADDGAGDLASRMPPQLKAYWLTGPGAAKIRWGTPGDFKRCVRALRGKFPEDTEGLCANLHHDALGKWPGQEAEAMTTEFTGAMVALLPSAADAQRLAAYSDEPADQLHMTLYYLGEAADFSAEHRDQVVQAMASAAEWLSPVEARAFGVGLWNPDGDSPCWVWNIGDSRDGGGAQTLKDLHYEVTTRLEDRFDGYPGQPELPVQYSPWAPHVAIKYGEGDPGYYTGGCGPVTFDRLRVGFGGDYTDFPLTSEAQQMADQPVTADQAAMPPVTGWSTPDTTAIAFENQQTGDGRVFAPGALYWEGNGPWPLMANENFDSHDDASLAGAIASMYRDGDRIGADGLLYLTQDEGAAAAMLLAQDAPLGVSVDLDDVDLEMVSLAPDAGVPEDVPAEPYHGHLIRASVLPTGDGGFILKGETGPTMTASADGPGIAVESRYVRYVVGPDGRVPRDAFELEAAAGDPGTGGTVVDQQRSGDFLMRIVRARVRGATLVTIPAFANARIVLDDPALFASAEATAAGSSGINIVITAPGTTPGATGTSSDYDRVLRHVRRSKSPVGPARVAQYLKIPIQAAQRLLALAASRGEVVKLTRGLYTDSTTSASADHVMTDDRLAASLTASATGEVDLPVADRNAAWDGAGAATRVFDWANGDTDKIARAFAYRDDNADPATKRAYKLGYADVVDGTLTIIPKGVFAAEGALNGSRGGVDIPKDQIGAVRDKLAAVRAHVDEVTGGKQMDDMQSSAWTAVSDLPPMPAAWFREPTTDELPPGSGGVHYSGGRIYGWVAQANEPHAGYAKRVVVNDLGRIDTTHFLRQRFTLDDGSTVKAGAFTMNAGHHRDGAECETSACQFDDTRTVAGIVTVGMNADGMWFSGAAAPWMSEWDRSVFMACQPSYHMKQARNGQWQLRAVLSVPVPGHSSPLLASAVIERSQLALTAAATMAEVEQAVRAERRAADTAAPSVPAGFAELVAAAVDAALDAREARKAAEAAEFAALLAEAGSLTASGDPEATMDVDTTDDGK